MAIPIYVKKKLKRRITKRHTRYLVVYAFSVLMFEIRRSFLLGY